MKAIGKMRDIKELWKEYQLGNHIDDDELRDLLTAVKSTLIYLRMFNDVRHQLVTDDFEKERQQLERYYENRKNG